MPTKTCILVVARAVLAIFEWIQTGRHLFVDVDDLYVVRFVVRVVLLRTAPRRRRGRTPRSSTALSCNFAEDPHEGVGHVWLAASWPMRMGFVVLDTHCL